MNPPRKRRISGMVIVVLAVMVTSAAVVANIALHRVVEDATRAEVLLQQLHRLAYRLSAIEWQAIGAREMSPKIVADVQEVQDDMTRTMGSLEQLEANPGNLRLVRQNYDAYSLAMNEEFRLIKAGNFSQAHSIDEELVDPAFAALTEALGSTGAAYRAHAKQMNRLASLGSVLVLLFSLATIGLLVWRAQKAQAAIETAAVEQMTLIRGQEELRLFADNVPSMTIAFDADLRCVFANKRYADFFGLDRTGIVGKHLREILGDKVYREVEGQFAQVLQGRAVTYRRAFELEDGSSRDLEVRLVPHIGDHRKVSGCFAVVDDITERTRAETELRGFSARLEQRVLERTAELEASNRELESFSYSISHDLRAPLRALHGYSYLLTEEYADRISAEGQHYLSRIRAASEHMGEMIDDLLDLARVTRHDLNRKPVDLGALAETVLAELREEEPQRSVTWNIDPNLSVEADPVLMKTMFDNLLRNAWKFTAERTEASIVVSASDVDGERGYCIRDNGAGFDMAYADKLFKPFQRLHDPERFDGTGIGLAIVQRIIQRHGGRIRAEGYPGEGASFRFTIP